ncbi:MAG: hypothetical protein RLZZ200_1918 [Pseudomonadota bacterium]|jgi:hypothetical protein
MRRSSPILLALLALLAGVVAVAVLLRGISWASPEARDFIVTLPGWILALLVGFISALLGRGLGLEIWWSAFLLIAPPLFAQLLLLDLGPGWYLTSLAVLMLVYWSTFSTRVPLYLAGPKVRSALLTLLPSRDGLPSGQRFTFMDLGCGLGGVVLSLARARPDVSFSGVELAPLPALLGWCRMRLSGLRNARVWRASLWNVPLDDADIVYAFLSPVPMPALWDKASREMKDGSLFVSNSFVVPGVPADQVIDVGDARGSQLHVWKMGQSVRCFR